MLSYHLISIFQANNHQAAFLPIPRYAPIAAPTIAEITVEAAMSTAIAVVSHRFSWAYIIMSIAMLISKPTIAPVVAPETAELTLLLLRM